MKAIGIKQFGGAQTLAVVDWPWSPPHDRVEVEAAWAGVNFVDTYQREGRYPGVSLPLVLGVEGSGVVRAAPADSGWKPGDRVAYTTGVQGTYAERVAVPAPNLVRVPDAVSLQTAAAAIEQGLTARVLIDDVARLPQGATVLVHAAAGGVGGLLVQMLRARGCRVLGVVSSAEKAQWLQTLGVEQVLSQGARSWVDEVRGLTAGQGPQVVFDSVGQTTFDGSLEALAMRGHLVLFGAASGPVPAVDPLRLMRKSATLTRPVMSHYLNDPDVLRARAAELFDAVRAQRLQLRIHACYPLADAALAHAALAARGTQGKLLLAINDKL